LRENRFDEFFEATKIMRYIIIIFLFISSLFMNSCSQVVDAVREELGFNSVFQGMESEEYQYIVDLESEIELKSKINEIDSVIDEVKSARLIGNPFINPKNKYLNLSIEMKYKKMEPINISISGKSFSEELMKNLNEVVKIIF
jgi:hypothetical protein